MGRLSPTQRTLAALRNRGCLAAVAEKWNPYAGTHGIRQDLFGFIDVLAIEPGKIGCLGVQCCASSGMAAHRRKIIEDCADAAADWLRADNRIELWGWRKVKLKRGGKAERWAPRVEMITREDVPESLPSPGQMDC